MGCCFSSEDKNAGLADERAHLLDPGRFDGPHPVHGSESGKFHVHATDNGDEQAALSRILHQNARDIMDTMSKDGIIEQNAYHDKARAYTHKLKSAFPKFHRQSLSRSPHLCELSPQTVLSASPVSQTDVQLINGTCEKASKAMGDVRVLQREDLVVSFGMPVP